MAVKTLTATAYSFVKGTYPNEDHKFVWEAATTAADGINIPVDADHSQILVMTNANANTAKTITFKAGDGIQGVTDLTISIPAGETHAIKIESGRFKCVSGTNKGYIHAVPESTDIKIAALSLL